MTDGPKAAGLSLEVDGRHYNAWTSGEVTRDLKDFSGSFTFTLRDEKRSIDTFPYASPPGEFTLRPGQEVKVYADGELVLAGYITDVEPNIDEENAEVVISGDDKAADLIDSAAAADGPAEFKNVKLEDAVKRICQPFGLEVRCEIDTGKTFPRYSLDLAEFAHKAIEKGARQRHALVMSDGVGGVVITRTGATRAPGDLTLPGNVLGSRGKFSHRGRHSETIVRGQAEKASSGRDNRAAPLLASGSPVPIEDRLAGDGSATERERRGTAATGRARDEEITRHRPIVHLARTNADKEDAQDEADWRMRTARAESEEPNYRVKGFGVDGRLWRVNEMTHVSDSYQGIERDMLISRVVFRESEDDGRESEITVTSPEAFDKSPVGDRRTNKPGKSGKKSGKATGALDGTAQAL